MIETSAPPRSGSGSAAATLWRAPLALHIVALALVLLVGLLAAGPRVAFSSDEGVAAVQARMLRNGDGWLYRYPLGGIDREDQARPFVRGDLGSKGLAPYAKHPLYPVVLAGLDFVGGEWGILLGGVIGTLLAAIFSALIARRLDPRLDRNTLWVVGAASPLFFDSYVVLAHTMAAAAVAAAVWLALLAAGKDRTLAGRGLAVVGMGACLVVASMLRTEALFVGGALAVAAVVLVGLGRLPLRRALLIATVGVASSGAAWLIDRTWSRAIIGTPRPGVPNAAPSSWLSARWQALHITWFQPSYSGGRVGDLALGLGAVLLVAAALLLHRHADRRAWIAGAMVAAAACYLVRLVLGSAGAVPGLALAFPAGWFLLWAAGRRVIDGVAAPLLSLAAVLVTGAVLATQYAIGGGVEWGGRYFAIVIAVAIPVLLFAAEPVIRRHGPDTARLVVGALVVVSLAASLTAVQALRHVHQDTAAVLDAIQRQAGAAGTSGGLDRPVVMSSNRLLPQIDYRDFDRYDWVVPDSDHLGRYATRLADRGVDRMVLVSPDLGADLAHLPGWRVVSSPPGLPLDVAVLEHAP